MASVCRIINQDVDPAPQRKRFRTWLHVGRGGNLGHGCALMVSRVHHIHKGPELRMYITGEHCDIRTGLPAKTVMRFDSLGLRIIPRAIHYVNNMPEALFIEFEDIAAGTSNQEASA